MAADYLATALECSTIMPFFSHSFPPQVMVSQGLAELMHAQLMRPKEKKNMLILSGDAQPLDVVGMYELAGNILQAIKGTRSHGCDHPRGICGRNEREDTGHCYRS